VRTGYEQVAGLDEALVRVRELAAQTVVFDIEPLIAHWDSDQAALDSGVARILAQAAAVPEVKVICFATNALRRPSEVPGQAGVRVVYFAAAGKPLRTSLYDGFPRPGAVVGDQLATDGILAWRLGYVFLQCPPPPGRVPAGPRLMKKLGSLVRPLLFTRPG